MPSSAKRLRQWIDLTADQGIVIALSVILFLLFLMQLRFLPQASFAISDEGVHALVGKWIWQGQVPYQGLYYSEPPLLPIFIGFFLHFSSSLFWPRLAYLILNLLSAIPLYYALRKIGGRNEAAMVAVLLYVTYEQMVEQNFRFLALRQLSNVCLVAYLYIGTCKAKTHGNFIIQTLLAAAGIFTTFMSAFNIFALSLAMCATQNRKRRLAELRRYAVMGLIIIGALLLFFVYVPHSFESTVLAHFSAPDVGRMGRITWTMSWDKNDVFFYAVSLTSLGLGCIFAKGLRWYCWAALAMIAFVFVPREFFPHYFDGAAVAFAIGICAGCVLVLRVCKSLPFFIPYTALFLIVAVHWTQVMPSMFNTWANSKDPNYYEIVNILRAMPDPVLTFFEPAFVIESGRDVLHSYLLSDFRTYGSLLGKQLTPDDYQTMAAQACTIFLSDWDMGYIPQNIQREWRSRYQTIPSPPGTLVLKTNNPVCTP